MYNNKKEESKYDENAIFTEISFYLVAVCFISLFIIGILHIGDIDSFGQQWGITCIMEACFALIGITFTPIIITFIRSAKAKGKKKKQGGRYKRNNKSFEISFPPKFKKFELNIIPKTLVVFAIAFTAQKLLEQIPLSIETPELLVGVVSAGPAEEAFFRGTLLLIFIEIAEGTKMKEIIEIIGVIITSILFAMIHVNYYNDLPNLLSTFATGLIFGFSYLFLKSLDVVILAHFGVNLWAVGQFLLGMP